MLLTVTFKLDAEEVPQALTALTVIFPDVVLQFTVIDRVFCPETIFAPAGTCQVYVRPLTDGTEYTTPACELLTDENPDIAPGLFGTAFNTFVCATLLPQTLLAVTES